MSAEANTAQLVGTQSGEVVVPTYNWTTLLAGRLRKMKHIMKYQHFSISAATPGSVSVKLESDTQEETVSLLIDTTWTPSAGDIPHVVHNQYCPEEVRDVVCPKPAVCLQSATTSTLSPAHQPTTSHRQREHMSASSATLPDTTHAPVANLYPSQCYFAKKRPNTRGSHTACTRIHAVVDSYIR